VRDVALKGRRSGPDEPAGPIEESPQPAPAVRFLTVGIGASAGGLEAFKSFLAHTPGDTGMAFVLVQHLAPDHQSMLADLLRAATAMPVLEAVDGMTLEANRVFVIPPNATLTVKAGRLGVERPAPPRAQRRPIDTFFVSLAEDQREDAVCIILSGTGSDGTLGLAAIKEHGGLTLAQAEFDHHAKPGMPLSATATGQVDDILAVEEMPAKLVAYQKHLAMVAATKDKDGARQDLGDALATTRELLQARSGHDFRGYKEKTFVRRMQRRMQILQIDTPDGYVARLREQPKELDVLFLELLIGVTQFFRDPAAFDALQKTVLKGLVKSKKADDVIRIWVPGCSTGQEVFTIAMLLRESMALGSPTPQVQIFGTDIDERALAVAWLGRYAKPMVGVSPERLGRWFAEDGDGYCIVPEIREMCLFSVHSLIKNPPFSKLDLVSCRNLLIYLDAETQDRVMRTFHFALKLGGALFLGSSEAVTRTAKLFAVKDKKHRIFERLAIAGPSLPDLSTARRIVPPAPPAGLASAAESGSADRIDKDARRLMEKYAPPHMVVDRDHEIVRFSGGDVSQYLEPSIGSPSFNLFNILRKNLRTPVRAVLQEAAVSGRPVLHENLAVRIDGKARLVTVIVEPMPDHGPETGRKHGVFVVAFQDNGPAALGGKGRKSADVPGDAMQALEQELRTTKFQLQSSTDEYEVVNEEMRSSNEEYQSINEELQSANEELETAKEEIQSVNEELQTINAEMASKNEQLTIVNSDLVNLLDSTEIATIFLDDNLRIKSFTPGITDIFPLRESDVGRPITDIVTLLSYEDLRRDAQTVIRKLSVIERQVSLVGAGMTFIMRIRPYRRVDNLIDGVVITFIDITERESAQAALRSVQDDLRLLIDSTADAIYCVDREGLTTLCNASFLRLLGFDRQEEVIGKDLHPVIHHSHPDGSAYRKEDCPINRSARSGEPAHVEGEIFFRRDGTSFPVEYWLRPMERGGELQGAVCTFLDVSERRHAQDQQALLLRELDHRIKNLFAVANGVVSLSARSALTPQDMAKTVQGRLEARARAHLLIRPAGLDAGVAVEGTTLGSLVQTIIAPYADPTSADDDLRAVIEGPEVPIRGEAITSFALVLHELATNAAKYGALSAPQGRVRVSWAIEDGQLALIWEERGGPVILAAPQREGFGSLLARRSASGNLKGSIAFEWEPEGLTVRLSAAQARLTV
jgi:two-component system CheB/CheR fusion protein